MLNVLCQTVQQVRIFTFIWSVFKGYLKLKTELEEGVKKVGTFITMRSCLESGSGPSSAVITSQKRKCRSDSSMPLVKRQAIVTPTHNIISRIEEDILY